jgi:hypothetical protein
MRVSDVGWDKAGSAGRRPTFFDLGDANVTQKKVGRRSQSLAGPTLRLQTTHGDQL